MQCKSIGIETKKRPEDWKNQTAGRESKGHELPHVPGAQDEDVGPEQVLLVAPGGPGLHEAQQGVRSDQPVQTPHLPQRRQTGGPLDLRRQGGLRTRRVSGAPVLGWVV